MLPIYQNNQASNARPPASNAGLWFERFFDKFNDKDQWKVQEQKNQWLKDNFTRNAGDGDQLESHAVQQIEMTKAQGGQNQIFACEWHFVTGMGNPHPVENGLSWHPTLGVPYLTGAAVKGLVRNWLETWEPEEGTDEQRQKLLNWFGSTSKNPKDNDYEALTGNLIFFDAFPIESVLMNVDIMTPHMGKWYEQGGDISSIKNQPKKIPADWHDPTPIPFLVVKKARFLFSIAPRNKDCNINVNTVMTALQDSLGYMGAGAKTAVGYGQMSPDKRSLDGIQKISNDRQQEIKIAQAKVSMTPLELELLEIESSVNDLPIKLLQELDKGHWENSEDQKIVAEKIKQLWQADKRWNPDFSGSNRSKVKQKDRCIKVRQYLE